MANNNMGWVIGIAVVVGLLWYSGAFQGTTTLPGTTTPAPTIVQTTPDTTTLSFDSFDLYNRNTEIQSTARHRVFINGKDRGWVSDSSTLTVAPGDKYEIYFGLNSTTYYPVKKEGIIALTSGAVTIDAGLPLIDTTLTMSAFDVNGALLSATNLQSLGASQVESMEFEFRVSTATAFGNLAHPGNGNTLCFQGNQTIYDQIRLDGGVQAPQPSQLANSVDTEFWCYYWTPISDDPTVSGDGKFKGVMVPDVGSTVDPNATNGNITIHAVDTSVDLHSQTLAFLTAAEDDLNTNLGTTTAQSVVAAIS